MNTKLKITSIIGVLFFLASQVLLAQDKKIQPPETPVNLIKDNTRDINIKDFDLKTKNILSSIEQRMLSAKHNGDIERVMQLQKESDKLTGSVTMSGEPMELRLIKPEVNPLTPENINAGLVSSVTGVKGINTCTEQIGFSASRIWSVFVYGPQTGAVNDLLRLCFSDDGGRSWTEKATIGFSPGNRMWQDQIDIELIENSSGDKYIWVAFGYATNNYAGQYRVGITIIKITGALSFAGSTLNWPGAVNSNYYYRPRIVSDNEAYRSNPWVYIACSFDSAVSGGYRSGEKVAICYSPYTVSPLFTYKQTSFTGLTFIYPSDFHCDIAYFRNGGQDSILLVESSLADSSRIAISKSSIGGYVSSSTFLGAFNVTPARRYHVCIASNGAYNSLMIVNMRKYSQTDWDIEYFLSTTGSTGSWETGYVDYRSNNSTRADITGFRSAPGFYSSASSENALSFVPVVYYSTENNVWGGIVEQMNHSNTNPFTAQPRAGVRYGPQEESCFALWTEYSGSTNVWASVGCDGTANAYRHLFFRGVVEGLWDSPADTMKMDTLTIYLRHDFSPYDIADSSKTFLTNDGYGDFWFTNALNLTNYFITAKHRNSLETWSSSPINFNPVFSQYNFANDPSQSYGNNVIQVDTDPLYAFYSGDVNNDGAIDLNDVISINNDANVFLTGYIISDLNGDYVVDLADLLLAYNNSSNFVIKITPP